MLSTEKAPSQGDEMAHSNIVNGEEPSSAVDAGKNAAPTRPSRTSGDLDLTKTDSAPSDKVSMRSHTSIPVVGTFPLGSLRVHKAMDSPQSQQSEGPQPDTSDMPTLEGDQVVAPPGSLNGGGSGGGGGDIFFLLDLPPNSTVGCDAKAIGTAKSQFHGFRDIPPGPHFIWVSEPDAMSRCGYWFVTSPQRQQVRVKQWDKFNEVLVTPPSDFEVRDMRDNAASLYPQLVPYGMDGGSSSQRQAEAGSGGGGGGGGAPGEANEAALLWRRLTACISERVLARVTGKTGVREWLVDTSDRAAGDEGGFLPATTKTTQTYQTLVGTGELTFLFPDGDVDVHTTARPGADTNTTTTIPDTSMDILRLLDTPGTGIADTDLLGELQFTFLTGLHLSNLACIEQWWHLVLDVVLRAHQLVTLRPRLSHAFLATVHAQMVYNEKYIAPNPSPSPSRHRSRTDAAEDVSAAARHEYGGPGDAGSATSLLDIVPGTKRKLRAALTLYKRRMNEQLLDLPGGQVTPEQGEVGKAFVALEEWFWKLGWDLRADYVKGKKGGEGEEEAEDDLAYEEDDEYRPVIVDLDDHGREVGLVSFS